MLLLLGTRWRRRQFTIVAVATLAFSCAAQVSRVAGAVQGTVVDQTGSTIGGAMVMVQNPATGQSRTTSTNSDGVFWVAELSVGFYELHVEAPGFSPYVNNAIVVSIGRVIQLEIRLAPATVQEHIVVSAQPPPIDITQTIEATTIDHERIEEAPVVSRNYLDFVLLAPQLNRSNSQGASGSGNTLTDSGFSFAGLRTRSNSLYIDGVENNDEFTGSARTELSPETVQESQVVNNGLSAESGGGASGHINVITKSGVNTLHGDAFSIGFPRSIRFTVSAGAHLKSDTVDDCVAEKGSERAGDSFILDKRASPATGIGQAAVVERVSHLSIVRQRVFQQ
jgi:Carboxypeptidase regulatory-like domain/TonB-dependent Receptor Plug Domain